MAIKTKVSANGTNGHGGAAAVEVPPAATRATKEKPAKAAGAIALAPLELGILEIPIVGTAPLLMHKFSLKSQRLIEQKQQGAASSGREKRDPESDYEESKYLTEDGKLGFPAIAFKAAAVTACTSLGKAITKVQARQAFHVIGQLVEIEGEPRPRTDMVRLPSGGSDVRYRCEVPEWRTVLRIQYNTRVLSREQLVNLINLAGFAVGVGEWRPEKDGMLGTFAVDASRPIRGMAL